MAEKTIEARTIGRELEQVMKHARKGLRLATIDRKLDGLYGAIRLAHKHAARALNLVEWGEAEAPWTEFQESILPDDIKARMIESQPGYIGTFLNSRYQVQATEYESGLGPVTWLKVVRRDRRAVHDWRDLQRVKNELVGRNCEAVEVYPAEGRLVDTNNQYHLFVFPPGQVVPLGFCERDVSDDVSGTDHSQRPFDRPPEDLNQRPEGATSTRVFGPPTDAPAEEQ